MISQNNKRSDFHRLLLNLSDKINLKGIDKEVVLSNLSIYYAWKNIRMSYKNNKFKISTPIWNEIPDYFEIIRDYFEYIMKRT